LAAKKWPELYDAKARWSMSYISCFQRLNEDFFFRKSKKCVRLIFTGRIVPLPDLALEFSWTRNENIEYQFVTSVHHPNQLFSCGRAGRIGEPTRYMFMACREDFWQGNRQVKLHLFSPSTVNIIWYIWLIYIYIYIYQVCYIRATTSQLCCFLV